MTQNTACISDTTTALN